MFLQGLGICIASGMQDRCSPARRKNHPQADLNTQSGLKVERVEFACFLAYIFIYPFTFAVDSTPISASAIFTSDYTIHISLFATACTSQPWHNPPVKWMIFPSTFFALPCLVAEGYPGAPLDHLQDKT